MEFFIDLDERSQCDLELLLNGSFYPLTGFMEQEDYLSSCKSMRLQTGELWPVPVCLPISQKIKDEIGQLAPGRLIILRSQQNLPLAQMLNWSLFKPDLEQEFQQVVGTREASHPYCKRMRLLGPVWYLGGRTEALNPVPHSDFRQYRHTPHELKTWFQTQGWTKIIAFQTRNPMHRCHVELTKRCLAQIGSDARLLINPACGPTQEEDVDGFTRVRCYEKILKYYPEGQVHLSLLQLSMRMAGPREALWHALIRQNL